MLRLGSGVLKLGSRVLRLGSGVLRLGSGLGKCQTDLIIARTRLLNININVIVPSLINVSSGKSILLVSEIPSSSSIAVAFATATAASSSKRHCSSWAFSLIFWRDNAISCSCIRNSN